MQITINTVNKPKLFSALHVGDAFTWNGNHYLKLKQGVDINTLCLKHGEGDLVPYACRFLDDHTITPCRAIHITIDQ